MPVRFACVERFIVGCIVTVIAPQCTEPFEMMPVSEHHGDHTQSEHIDQTVQTPIAELYKRDARAHSSG